jgi:multidrug transporter EmrE-like cation transporter
LKLPGAAGSEAIRYHEGLPVNQTQPETQTVEPPPHRVHPQSLILVFCCTLTGAAAQIFMKMGATKISHPSVMQIIGNVPLMIGYSLYGINTLLLALALRKAPLSLLYPIISLTYVWVTILSLLIFKENLNAFKVGGLCIVITGVAVLGMDGRR